jgi:ferredoxin
MTVEVVMIRKKDWGMLMIHPDECINCGACETECPVEAIYEDSGVPEDQQQFVKFNETETMSLSDEGSINSVVLQRASNNLSQLLCMFNKHPIPIWGLLAVAHAQDSRVTYQI